MNIAMHVAALDLVKQEPYDVLFIKPVGNISPIEPEIKKYARTLKVMEVNDLVFDRMFHKAPTKEDVKEALEWAADKNNILCTCNAGVSRSSAFAYILSCAKMSPIEAIKVLNYKIHTPNELIVKLGSEILNNPEIVSTLTKWKEQYGIY